MALRTDMMRTPFRVLALLMTGAMLAACDLAPDWFGGTEAPPLPGQRLSVLALEGAIEPDPRIADLDVRLPRPYVNESWPQSGGYPDHAMHHLAGGDNLALLWRSDIGEGSGDDGRILTTPVVAGGRVFAIDAVAEITAFDANTGNLLWRIDPRLEDDEEDGFGGGLAYAGGLLFATTGFGHVLALDPTTGAQVWRQDIGIPMRAAPVVVGGRMFVVTYDNQLWALSAEDGAVQWSNAGISETAGLLGAASPAVDNDIVIAPYSSGELIALRVENGRTVWADSLGAQRLGTGSLAALNDINGSPVIDRGVVYAISHGGRLVAIDVRTGSRVWEQDIAGLNTPWIAGEYLFVVTVDGDVVCLSRRNGRVKWVHSLPRFEDPGSREDPVFWNGPLLLSDRLIVLGSNGDALAISPYTGRLMGRLEMPHGVRVAPVAANGTLFILTDDGNLVALR
ncbi:MAG: PQQ-binding-like beta-propeller repeat protein [Rhodospirillaceae bacterium]|jgi:outer membrane protein assembly factor BamB|nr:PQQ-binding-like beta-propeller repeat protein [Rhodospirillaceae bacterium]